MEMFNPIIIVANVLLIFLFVILAIPYSKHWAKWRNECKAAYKWLIFICFVTGIVFAFGIQESLRITKILNVKEITNVQKQ